MEISDIRIRKTLHDGKMKAVVSVTFDNTFVVHDIKIIQGHSGYFVAMPSRRMPNGEYRDIAHPINSDARNHLQRSVLDYYLSHKPDDIGQMEEESSYYGYNTITGGGI